MQQQKLMIFVLAAMMLPSPAVAQFEVVARAQPDEFYTGVGTSYIRFGDQPPDAKGQPRVNYDYLWSLTADQNHLWFGTGANVAAVTASQLLYAIKTPDPVISVSRQGIPYRVWEFGQSTFPLISDKLRPYFGDWRPPQVFQYDLTTGQLVDRTPDDPLINDTLGLRSAGSHNGVVILAGPSLVQLGICLFAFDSHTGEYLGSKYLLQYSNIRQWTVAGGQLYTTALNSIQTRVRGSVLRWTGSRSAPFKFEVVGELDNDGAYLTEHLGRLFVGTWPSIPLLSYLGRKEPETPPQAGIWMSPLLIGPGLTRRHAGQWKKVWQVDFYEPDPSMLGGYSLGAMASYGGYLYWGTLHYPLGSYQSFLNYHDFAPPAPVRNVQRNPVILRGYGFNLKQGPQFELLYGDENLTTFVPQGHKGGTWTTQKNRMGRGGIYGGSGFDNPGNGYIWSAAVHNNRLYFGTSDTSTFLNAADAVDGNAPPGTGADLWVFPSTTRGASRVDGDGCGNPLNHGIRNLLSTPMGLMLGTANSANLMSDFTDELPDGGWELLLLVE